MFRRGVSGWGHIRAVMLGLWRANEDLREFSLKGYVFLEYTTVGNI